MTNKKEKFDLQPHDIDAFADALTSFDRTSKIMERMVTTNPRGKKGLKLTYQFKIKLRGITNPPVWRRVLVPVNFTFSGFHAVIQEAFGWWNEHLYCFGDKPYSQSLYIAEENKEDWYRPDYDARKFTLGELFGDGGIIKKFCYVYDFGDDWIHDITLEKVFDEYSDHATCIKGKGACPEEDSGGVWEYEDMKEDGEIEVSAIIDLAEINKHVEAVKPTGFEPW